MTYQGTVQNGVVKFNGDVPLADGTQVSIVPVAVTKPASSSVESDPNSVPPSQRPEFHDPNMTIWQKLVAIGRWVETQPCDLPEDLALNHDHYLYGTPKKRP